MKSSILLFTLLLSSLSIYSQTNEFAPVGARWWYEFTGGLPFEPPSGYYSIECVKDTVFNDTACKYLKSYSVIDGATIENENFFLYQNEDTIFYLIDTLLGQKIDTTFQVLYIFNAEIGASWPVGYGDYTGVSMAIPCMDDEANYLVVDAYTMENINGVELKRISYFTDFSESDSYWVMEGNAYEIFGSTKYLLPLPLLCFTEDYYPNQLRCYEDKNIGLVKLTEEDNCEVITSVTDEGIDFKVYPYNNGIQIKTAYQEYITYIYNLQGQLIYSNNHAYSTFISLDKFSAGFYIIYINFQSHSSIFKFELL
ncbi:MAG: T9SS type A sorting domain-containing protein [Chitinophagales bacterium]|nr:T9SS type A sorting domain-containing protein [Chitinophagales bacterium]